MQEEYNYLLKIYNRAIIRTCKRRESVSMIDGNSTSTQSFTSLPSVTIYSARLLKFLNSRTSLYKECIKENLKIEKLPCSISTHKGKIKKIEQMQLSPETLECTKIFIEVLKGIPYADFSNFTDHLKPGFIIEIDDPLHQKGPVSFNILDQKITIYRDLIRKSIFHELLHKFVYRRFNNRIYAGFTQAVVISDGFGNRIGDGIDEIYTSLLTRRYFSCYGAEGGYEELYSFGYYFEDLIGRENMERLYFRSDLYGLKESLAEYSNQEEEIDLIKKIDHLFYIMSPLGKNSLLEQRLAKNTFLEIIEILSLMFKRKIAKMEKEHCNEAAIQKYEKRLLSLLDMKVIAKTEIKIPILDKKKELKTEYRLSLASKKLLLAPKVCK